MPESRTLADLALPIQPYVPTALLSNKGVGGLGRAVLMFKIIRGGFITRSPPILKHASDAKTLSLRSLGAGLRAALPNAYSQKSQVLNVL
jgi:hypothetical protein